MENEEKILTGEIRRSELEQKPFSDWYLSGYQDYYPNQRKLEALRNPLKAIKILAFIGTWCPDTQREYPHLIKILDSVYFPENQIITFGLDQDKMLPGGEKPNDVAFVPTFIFFRDGKEIGRIVERPGSSSLEEDILKIIDNHSVPMKSKPVFPFAAVKKTFYLTIGLLLGALFTYFIMKQFQHTSVSNDSHVIAYEIKKLNKMVVAEQTFSDVYSHKSSLYFPGMERFFSFNKKVLYLVNAKVQATYDLSKLDMEVDSVKKIIYIHKVPDLEIKTYPDVSIFDLDQSTFNKFSKDELNEIKDKAVAHIEKTIDRKKLEKEAHDQLIQNLSDLYLLAQTYGWKVEDKTPYSKELELMFK